MARNSITVKSAAANFDATDVGKLIFVIVPSTGVAETSPSVTVITAVKNASTITIGAGGLDDNCAQGGCWVVWGHDDTAALLAANSDALTSSEGASPTFTKPGQTIYLPCGGYMTNAGIFDTAGASGAEFGPNVIGAGSSCTVLFPRPDSKLASLDGGPSWYMLFRGYRNHIQGFAVNGSDIGFATGMDVIDIRCSECIVEDVFVGALGQPGGIGINVYFSENVELFHVGNAEPARMPTNLMVNCGVTGGGAVSWYDMLCTNARNAPNLLVQGVNSPPTGDKTQVLFFGGVVDECGVAGSAACTQIVNSQDVFFVGMTFWSQRDNATQYAMSVDGSSQVRLIGANIGCYTPTTSCANGNGLNIAAGGQVWSIGSEFRSYGSGVGVNNGGSFFDGGGNIFDGGGMAFAGPNVPTPSNPATWPIPVPSLQTSTGQPVPGRVKGHPDATD
jgi:hypothetical protein